MQKEIWQHFVQYLQITSKTTLSRREKGGPSCGPLASDRVQPKDKGEETWGGGVFMQRVFMRELFMQELFMWACERRRELYVQMLF